MNFVMESLQDKVKEITQKRKRLGITQSQLAKRAGVSQSLIAKLESGKTEPSYSKVYEIIRALETLENKEMRTADEIMTDQIISVKPKAKVREAAEKMTEHQISQLPVVDGEKVVGSITESDLITGWEREKVEDKQVKDVMGVCFPLVSKNTLESALLPLLKHFQAVLVAEEGSLSGIITKQDLL